MPKPGRVVSVCLFACFLGISCFFLSPFFPQTPSIEKALLCSTKQIPKQRQKASACIKGKKKTFKPFLNIFSSLSATNRAKEGGSRKKCHFRFNLFRVFRLLSVFCAPPIFAKLQRQQISYDMTYVHYCTNVHRTLHAETFFILLSQSISSKWRNENTCWRPLTRFTSKSCHFRKFEQLEL